MDNFLLETRQNKLDLQGTVLNDKVLAVKEKFLDTFYYGNASSNVKEFDGLHQLISSTTYNSVCESSSDTGSALNISKFREAIDLIQGFRPQMIVMTKLMRRYLSTYYDSVGDKLATGVMFGAPVPMFDGIPIVVSDHITNTEATSSDVFSASTGGAQSSIFILSFDPDAVCGVQGSTGLKVLPIGDLETKDAKRWRIKWYCGLKFKNLRSSAKIYGIDPDGTVAP